MRNSHQLMKYHLNLWRTNLITNSHLHNTEINRYDSLINRLIVIFIDICFLVDKNLSTKLTIIYSTFCKIHFSCHNRKLSCIAQPLEIRACVVKGFVLALTFVTSVCTLSFETPCLSFWGQNWTLLFNDSPLIKLFFWNRLNILFIISTTTLRKLSYNPTCNSISSGKTFSCYE